jgi:predicted nucleic acid-binding protein
MILLDSDIVIEVTRAHDQTLLARWTQLAATDEAIAYSPVTAAELWVGACPREHPSLTAFFDALLCLPADNETGRIAGNYIRLYRASHSLELADALIAAAALQNGALLWTRNRKHYPMKDISFY